MFQDDMAGPGNCLVLFFSHIILLAVTRLTRVGNAARDAMILPPIESGSNR